LELHEVGRSALGRKFAEPLTCEFIRELTPADLLRLAAKRSNELSIPDRLAELSHRHHLAARMIADGMTNTEVAYACNYTPGHITGLKADPAFQELVASYSAKKEAVYLDVHQRLGTLGMTAVERLQERLDDPQKSASLSFNDLRNLVETALDRSLAPKKGGFAQHGNVGPASAGLVVNLNFDQPKASANTIDIVANETEPSNAR